MSLSKLFQSKGLKATPARKKVYEMLASSEYLLSVDELYLQLVKKDPKLSISTVYRTLESFRQVGLVEANKLPGEAVLYFELSHEDHAHHLICSSCHKVIHLDECPLHGYDEKIAKTHHFTIQNHQLDIYGLCESCQPA